MGELRILTGIFLLALGSGFGASTSGQQVPPVVAATALSRVVGPAVQLPGTVVSARRVWVPAFVQGVIESVEVREGDRVAAGSALARIDTTILRARRATLGAQISESSARVRAAESKLGRALELFGSQLISAEQLDDLRFELEALEARTATLRAQIAEFDLSIENSAILAPFSGAVAKRRAETGGWANAGDPLFELVDGEQLEVSLHVPEIHLSNVAAGQSAMVRLDAAPAVRLPGNVVSIAPAGDETSRTFEVRVVVSARGGLVRPGMTAAVELAPARPRSATIVPKDAVIDQPGGWAVFVLGPDDTVNAVPVKTGSAAGQWMEVSGAVSPGDRVVIYGNERLRHGQIVAPQLREVSQP